MLSGDLDVVTCSIAAFGQVLCALGANALSAGIGWLETFREISLQPGRVGFAADRTPRSQYYYVPQLLSYVHPGDLNTMLDPDTGSETMRNHYMCDCDACVPALPTTVQDKKRHFMICRQRELRELARTPPNQRTQYIRDKLELALELGSIIEEEALVRVPTEHFVRWIAVIDALERSRPQEAGSDVSEQLDDVINEARRWQADDPACA